MRPPLGSHAHLDSSHPLSPTPARTCRARRPRRGDDWTNHPWSLSNFHRVCSGPILTAFAPLERARLHGSYLFRSSLDGLHFRCGLLALLTATPHLLSRARSCRAFPIEGCNYRDVLTVLSVRSSHGWLVFGIVLKNQELTSLALPDVIGSAPGRCRVATPPALMISVNADEPHGQRASRQESLPE